MKKIRYCWWFCLFFSFSSYAWQWIDLWQTPDQQASKLLQTGNPQAAAKRFKNKNWQAVSHYRAGNFQQAYNQFSSEQTSDAQYNAGNAAAYMGNYQQAIKAYDQAIALNPTNKDAIKNREIVKKLLPPQSKNLSDHQNKTDAKHSSSEHRSSQNFSSQQQTNSLFQQKKSPSSSKNQLQKTKQTTSEQQENENNNQLLRRQIDEPGGLLQQKFLRDYARRHGAEGNM